MNKRSCHKKVALADVFGNLSDSEPDEPPPGAKLSKNMGEQTKFSAGPNTYTTTKRLWTLKNSSGQNSAAMQETGAVPIDHRRGLNIVNDHLDQLKPQRAEGAHGGHSSITGSRVGPTHEESNDSTRGGTTQSHSRSRSRSPRRSERPTFRTVDPFAKAPVCKEIEPQGREPEPDGSYVCHLCMRKFVSEKKLLKHEMKSELHATNLAKKRAAEVAAR